MTLESVAAVAWPLALVVIAVLALGFALYVYLDRRNPRPFEQRLTDTRADLERVIGQQAVLLGELEAQKVRHRELRELRSGLDHHKLAVSQACARSAKLEERADDLAASQRELDRVVRTELEARIDHEKTRLDANIEAVANLISSDAMRARSVGETNVWVGTLSERLEGLETAHGALATRVATDNAGPRLAQLEQDVKDVRERQGKSELPNALRRFTPRRASRPGA